MPREYPDAPVVAVGVVLLDGDSVLLVERARPPSRGLFTVPGGGVEVGEALVDAAARELFEETGLRCRIGPVVEVVDRVVRDEAGRVRFHYVIVDYLGTDPEGTLRAATDASTARFVPFDRLDGVALTEGLLPVIDRARALRGAGA